MIVEAQGSLKILAFIAATSYTSNDWVGDKPTLQRLDTKTWRFKYMCCRGKNRKADSELIKTVEQDVNYTMDLMKFLQRLRVHGQCLKMMVNK